MFLRWESHQMNYRQMYSRHMNYHQISMMTRSLNCHCLYHHFLPFDSLDLATLFLFLPLLLSLPLALVLSISLPLVQFDLFCLSTASNCQLSSFAEHLALQYSCDDHYCCYCYYCCNFCYYYCCCRCYHCCCCYCCCSRYCYCNCR